MSDKHPSMYQGVKDRQLCDKMHELGCADGTPEDIKGLLYGLVVYYERADFAHWYRPDDSTQMKLDMAYSDAKAGYRVCKAFVSDVSKQS